MIQKALPRAARCLNALADIMDAAPFLVGSALTIADPHATPMFAYFVMTPEAEPRLAPHRALRQWWGRMAARPSFAATAFT